MLVHTEFKSGNLKDRFLCPIVGGAARSFQMPVIAIMYPEADRTLLTFAV